MAAFTAAEHARALYGLSRGTQATLSVAQPLVGALVAAPDAPPWRLGVLVVASLAGFWAVFAANDLLDLPLDRRAAAGERPGARDGAAGWDVDGAGARHPVAAGLLPVAAAMAWATALAGLAVGLAALLSWWCMLLFAVAVALQALYCLLATVSPLKLVVSGVMVAAGGAVGWAAVTDGADWARLGWLALWLAAWEAGGRNVPNDMADVAGDARLGVATVPVRYGMRASAVLAFGCLLAAAGASLGLAVAAWDVFGPAGVAGTALAGWLALLRPGVALLRRADPPTALAAFNRASFHPVWVLAALCAGLVIH